MAWKRCVECELDKDLSWFHPRHRKTHEGFPPASEKVFREPRCAACMRAYSRRRRWFRRLAGIVAELGGTLLRVKGTSYRKVQLQTAGLLDSRDALRREIRKFNDKLPDESCDVDRNGMALIDPERRSARRTPGMRQLELFGIEGRGRADD